MKFFSSKLLLLSILLPSSAFAQNGLSQLYFDGNKPTPVAKANTPQSEVDFRGSSSVLPSEIERAAAMAPKVALSPEAKVNSATPIPAKAPAINNSVRTAAGLKNSKTTARSALKPAANVAHANSIKIHPDAEGPRVDKSDANKMTSGFFWPRKGDGSCRDVDLGPALCRKTLALSGALFQYTGSDATYHSLCHEKCENPNEINVPVSMTIVDNPTVNFEFTAMGPECRYQFSKAKPSAPWSVLAVDDVKCACLDAKCS